ncbi:small ribosomal subunit Rsm22 family protein [Natronolimnobius baerhuensis]|uniref:SAM-dependent methyltransferase n=1 Tax=Natronolimnobius baerhuensis TaxID=253108 RepID=A0A202ED12_9EURY|nr:class I SAM-dependent methyltransferase [Natronolimnobius baerhuensis]OVE86122.1 SAM-dependent methyltransferase [Natronolimnobius baerhuensis]
MSDQREAIRSNAKYLRNVRPIDPDEICEYVEGNPHPAVVRQHLREDAVDLGLIEREDGTFEPVPEEPIRPNLRPVTTFPSTYADALEEFLVDQYGVNWHEDATGDLLRSTIRRFKSSYLERRAVEYTEDVAAGYAIYHLPAYYAAIQYALEDLADRGLLDRTMRVLDVGAGVGGPALGLADYLPDDALLEYHALEPSSAADILEDLLPETGRNVHTSVHRTTAEAFDPATVTRGEQTDAATPFDPTAADDGFDLILACNVLSELTDPEAVLRDYLELLAPDGTLVAIAPADKNTSVQLRDLERTLEDERLLTQSVFDDEEVGGGEASDQTDADVRRQHRRGTVTVYSPTVRLWPGERPSDRGWSFDVRPDLEVPEFQRKLDEATPEHDEDHAPGEFVNVDVQYSASLLRLDGTRRIDIALETSDWAKMAEMDRHVTNRIDLTAAKLSHSLSADDDDYGQSRSNPVFKISDGSESIDHYAVLTNETSLNRPLLEADYGALLSFEQILVLWNDDEQAYNLVVDEETIVDHIM